MPNPTDLTRVFTLGSMFLTNPILHIFTSFTKLWSAITDVTTAIALPAKWPQPGLLRALTSEPPCLYLPSLWKVQHRQFSQEATKSLRRVCLSDPAKCSHLAWNGPLRLQWHGERHLNAWIHARRGLSHAAALQTIQLLHSQTRSNLSRIKTFFVLLSIWTAKTASGILALWSLTQIWPFIRGEWVYAQRFSDCPFIWYRSKRSSDQRRAPPSALGLLLVPPPASTPNKVSRWRARSSAERLRLHSVPTDVLSLIHSSFCGRLRSPHAPH